jgi:SRSO17 transposase
LQQFIFRFTFLFTSLTRNVSFTALSYLKGMMLARRRNCQVMAEELGESNQQRLHHFISASPWQFQQVMDTVTLQFWELLQRAELDQDTCLIIDETGNPKKGRHSAGVKRQYCGQVGKTDNCQVGVFGALCGGSLVNLVQGRLSAIDKEVSKIDQARQLIDHVNKELNIGVQWICFDAFYGRDTTLLAHLIKNGQQFVADVPEDTRVWLEPFQMRVPVHKPGARGRKATIAKANQPDISVREYAALLKPTDWKYLTIRHQSGGRKLKAWFHSREVYMLNPLTNRKQLITLLIREDVDGTIKYSFCHCTGKEIKELAYRQSKRYFIEKAFREGKKELGLNQYQTRSEESYHKHMAMVMLGQLFINEEKLYQYKQSTIWMTTQDVIHTLKSILGFVKRSLEELLNYIMLKQPPDKRLTKKLINVRI